MKHSSLSYPLRKDDNLASTLYSTSPGMNIYGNASAKDVVFIRVVTRELKDLFKILGLSVDLLDFPLSGCLRLDWGYTWTARKSGDRDKKELIESIVEAKLEEHIGILTVT